MNAMREPSGDHRGWVSDFLLVVRRIGWPPCDATTQMSGSSASSFKSIDVTTYATHLASGEICASLTARMDARSSKVIGRRCCAVEVRAPNAVKAMAASTERGVTRARRVIGGKQLSGNLGRHEKETLNPRR